LAKAGKRKKDKRKKSRAKKVKSPPKGAPQCCPYLYYAEPRRAVEWLGKAFGLEAHMVLPSDDGDLMHAELRLGKAVFMLGRSAREPGTLSPRRIICAGAPAAVGPAHHRAIRKTNKSHALYTRY